MLFELLKFFFPLNCSSQVSISKFLVFPHVFLESSAKNLSTSKKKIKQNKNKINNGNDIERSSEHLANLKTLTINY